MSRKRKQKSKSYYFGFIYNGMEAKEWAKCRKSPEYFIKHYVKIPHPEKGLVDFNLYDFQVLTLLAFALRRFNIVLKPRQMGITTLIAAYVLWLTLFHNYKEVVLISIKYSNAKSMLRRIKIMFNHLPDFLKQKPITTGSGDRVGNASTIEFSNGSIIKAVASTEDAGRSDSLSLLVMDEAAFQRYASTIWASGQPTLSAGGSAIISSTAFGMGGFFYAEWAKALQGLNGFTPIKLDWRMHPDRGDEWYYEQLKALGHKRTMQEIDCNFLQSGYNVYDIAKIRAIEDRLLEQSPIVETQIGAEGKYYQYLEYVDGLQYYIGADIASGRARDYSAFSIYDEQGRGYACFKGKLTVREFSNYLIETGYQWGSAMLAPEVNGIGEGVVAIAQDNNYPYIYNATAKTLKLGQFEKDESIVQGWVTTGKSRHAIIEGMDYDIDNDLVEINNPFFVQEAYNFIYDNSNRPVAKGKTGGRNKFEDMYEDNNNVTFTDDAIIGECITNEVRKQGHKFAGNLPMIGGLG